MAEFLLFISSTEVNSTISLKDLRILFLYEFKLGHSAATASRNINSVFGKALLVKGLYPVVVRKILFWGSESEK